MLPCADLGLQFDGTCLARAGLQASIAQQQSAPFKILFGTAEGLGLLAVVTAVAWIAVYYLYYKRGGQDARKHH